MNIEKSCKTCRDKNNCCLLDKIEFDLETEVQCKLEEGIFEEVIQEHLDLSKVFDEMQEQGIIKKSVNTKKIDDDYIRLLITEMVSEGLWKFLLSTVSDITPKIGKMSHDNFYCSEWR